MTAAVKYRDFSITCESTGNAQCPVVQSNESENPYNSAIMRSEGIWSAREAYYAEEDRLFNTVIPLLPADSEIRMVVRYALYEPHNIAGYTRDTTAIMWETLSSKATLQTNKFTSNQGNLTASL